MSLARIHTVQRSRKPAVCGSCGEAIPVGSAYLWFTVGFRGRKRSRHVEHGPRDSERESSAVANIYGAIESFEDRFDGLTADTAGDSLLDDIEAGLSDIADEAQGVLDEYGYAIEAMGEAGENGPLAERRDVLSEAVEAYADFVPDGSPYCMGNPDPDSEAVHDERPEPGCPDCDAAVHDIAQQAIEHVRDVELP